jgi:hypothetical protein
MAFNIETFNNLSGGNVLYKALTHPVAWAKGQALLGRLRGAGRIALYDVNGYLPAIASIFDLSGLDLEGVFVQSLAAVGARQLGHSAEPITALRGREADVVLVLGFAAERQINQARHLMPQGAQILSLDELRLPDDMITVAERYLDPLNFATNFAFFRESEGQHTRLVTANYWSGYGSKSPKLWLRLYDDGGTILAEWHQDLPGDGKVGAVMVDSAEVKQQFSLGEFTGQLFVHVIGAAGHDVVKYALDTYGDDEIQLSCTHDANAWPSDRYAGLPAPRDGEQVLLWVQNSHPRAIPAGEVGLNLMGREEIAWLDDAIPPYGTCALDTATLLPKARWPQQIEIRAAKHFVRPRYEVLAKNGRRRIAHANVERADLKPDPQIPELANLMGKGYLLPAPILPPAEWRSWALPTPMATTQDELPLALEVYDASGMKIARHAFGRLARAKIGAIEIGELVPGTRAFPSGYGHMELLYDFDGGGAADGWLHALFRYEARNNGHAAETSFGAHIFNTALTYRGEPQSYAGPAPGLSTRLFLRLGLAPLDTFCHLVYPASTPWHETSDTNLILHDGAGEEVARRHVEIACSGSLLWRYSEMFDKGERTRAGKGGYVIIRDTTCRLFGYHGLMAASGSFSLDHMFGF